MVNFCHSYPAHSPHCTNCCRNMPSGSGDQTRRSFRSAKTQLTSSCLLVHFDPDQELILSCDASLYGFGAVLSHRVEDGSDKPVAFASRSLAPAEKRYAQLEKEGIAIIYGVKKFHQYLFGRNSPSTLITSPYSTFLVSQDL